MTDSYGGQGSQTSALPIFPAPPSTTRPPSPRKIAPAIAGARQSHSVWREGSKLATISRQKQPPVGTTFSFRLNQHAALTLRSGGFQNSLTTDCATFPASNQGC